MEAPPPVTVIIPVLDDAARLRRCLDALRRQTYKGPIEILVIDNGSRDDPAAVVARFPGCRLLRETRPGSYAARNKALQEARGSILAFTDSDCVPDPDWLQHATRHLGDGVGLVGGAIRLFPEGEGRRAGRLTLAETYEAVHGFPQEDYVRRHFAVTANLVTTRDVMDQVGPFDTRLKSGGDQDWGQRAHAAGFRAVYASDAVVGHPMRRTLAELAAKTRRTVGGMHDRHGFDQHMTSAFTFWKYIGKHYLTPVRTLPGLRAAARRAGVPSWKLLVVTWHRQGVRAAELVRLRRGRSSRR